MKAIIVGAGGTARSLLAGLADHWEITLIDRDEDRLERARKVRDIQTVVGDASSRVVLERCGLSDADAVITTADDDDVNLEVCRLARQAEVSRVVAVALDPERLDEYRAVKVQALSRARLTARRIEMQVEPRRVTTAAFADGLAEAIEFRITPDAPVVNRALRDLRSERWLVAAVLREGSLIVPHGDTVLRTDDLVTVVGASSDYPDIVRLFASGQARFPLDVGRKVVTFCENAAQIAGHVAEAAAFIRSSAAESLVMIHDDPASATGDDHEREIDAVIEAVAGLVRGFEMRTRAAAAPAKQISRIAVEEGAGVIVLPSANPVNGAPHIRASHALAVLEATGIPVLMARGTHPYQRIVVPARETPAAMAAARAAIDLAVLGATSLRVAAVVPPAYLGGDEARVEARATIAHFREEAAVHGLTIDAGLVEGNPIRQLVEEVGDSDLLVIGVHPGSRSAKVFAQHLARRVPVSMLMVPDRPDAGT